MERFSKFRETRAERSVICFLRILIFFLPAICVCLIRFGERKRSGSVCAIGVVALRIVRVNTVLLRLGSGRNRGDQEVGDSLSF